MKLYNMDETYLSYDEKPAHDHNGNRGHDKSNYIHPTAVIFSGVVMGKGNYIGPYCVIGAPAEHRGSWNPREPGRVVIGNNNIFTGHVTIDASYLTDGHTIVIDDCYFMKHSHVGHDAYIGQRVTLSVGAVVGGHTFICDFTNVGCNAFIHQRQVIAPYCMIGAGAVITAKTETQPVNTYAGNPARFLGENKAHSEVLTGQLKQAIWVKFNQDKEIMKSIANKTM